jgi:cytochrome P450
MKTTSAEFDKTLVTPEFVADPYSTLRLLREESPIYWSDSIGGWILTGYDDILVSFKDTAHFSNENRLGKALNYLPPEKQVEYKAFKDHYATKSLLHSDPPDHTRMRNLVVREFNAKVVEQMKPRMQEVVDGLIDAALAKGEMDIIPDLASALPIHIIAQILGVPAADRHLFRIWADNILSFQGVNKPSEESLRRAQEAIVSMRPYIHQMAEERRHEPKEDLLGKFVAAESEGGRISEEELVSTCVTLFVAGQDTTIALISNAIYTLLSHPEQLQLLRENPTLLASAIEETLRFESPIPRQPRLMKEDLELRGNHLKKGDVVFQMLNAANRDPAYFRDPDKFDIRRENNRHMAFGQGIHFCVGAVLARAEALIAVGTTLKRLPNLRLVSKKPDWDTDKRNSRSLKTLKVQF